jgi:SpoVK/Ycf46/Vps4 family AAA+-type ATPase
MQHDATSQAGITADQQSALQALTSLARDKLHALEDRAHGGGEPIEPAGVLLTGARREPATRVAAQVARELGRDLYRVDLATVISKYIGETEKNLNRVLETAERTGAVLFVDDGDALFGRTSEVRSSDERYANLDVNYLLQRLQSFEGLAILACRGRVDDLGTAAHDFGCVIEFKPEN